MKKTIAVLAGLLVALAASAQTSSLYPAGTSVQAGETTTNASGGINVTFATPYSVAPEITPPSPISTSTTVVTNCQVATRSTSGFTGSCFTSTGVIIGGQTVSPVGAGVTVMWTAVGKTQ